MTTAAIIVAAGRGLRAGGDVPKQWRILGNRTVAEHTLHAFGDHPRIDRLVMVLHPDDIAGKSWPTFPKVDVVAGGDTRAASVLAGLEAIEGAAEYVLIHDVARPLVSASLIDRVLDALARLPCAAPALPMTDALWCGKDGQVTESVDRSGLFRAQTPQGFRLADILAAHRSHTGAALDDVEVARAFGLAVAIVEGEERNMKITTPDDFARAERYLEQAMDIRTGSGFDVHAFGPGTHVTLCGVAVPHDRGLVGHSDADVGLHAATDAIYGAMAAGDIGRHFPPGDPQWKGAASEIFLRHAVELATSRGYRIGNIDVTLICELPKIGPHAIEMQGQMSRIMGVGRARISVKATTTERLGFTGREEGIAAMATVTLVQP